MAGDETPAATITFRVVRLRHPAFPLPGFLLEGSIALALPRMPNLDSEGPPATAAPGWFASTHWSVVLRAGQSSSSKADEALARLCEVYWYPLYAFIRRQGHNPPDAEDLAQAFFARFLEKDYVKDVNRQKGKFRSFLLASLKHFLADQWDRTRAQKRGGDKTHIPLDAQSAESRYLLEPRDNLTPDRIFERRWALTLLDQAMARLREEFALAGKAEFFDQLKSFMTAEKDAATYADAAAKLITTEAAVKMSVQRMRRRYRELLRAEIANTVADPEQIDEELRNMAQALRG